MERLPALYKYSRIAGVWPPEHPRFYHAVQKWIRLLIMVYYVIGLVLHLIHLLQDSKAVLQEYIDGIFIAMCMINCFYNALVTTMLREKIIKLLEMLTNNEQFGEPPNMDRLSRRLDIIVTVTFYYIWLGAGILIFREPFLIKQCESYNERDGRDVLCGYTTKMHYPYNIKDGSLWYLHLIVELVGAEYILLGGAAMSWSMLTSIELIIAKIDHLKLMIKYTINSDMSKRAKKRKLGYCVSYHIDIIRFVEEFNGIHVLLLSPAVLNYNVLIGSQVLSLSLGFTFKAAACLLAWVSIVFVISFCCERLIHKSMSIGNAAYFSNWYQLDFKLRKDLAFIVMRSQKPLIVKAGKLGPIGLLTFSMIMKGGYTYGTMKSGF